ncbi:MAG TPA: 8-amino-7-oxononanoate synthase [Planctomycetota bacterium]|nr:8-amino-7-oxononanoate synthase [Planctomycetota bacterium]
MSWFEPWIARAVADLASSRLLRDPKVVESVRGPFVTIGGREVLSFCSNDYLGLSQHERLTSAVRAGSRWGAGSSRLMAGTTAAHRELERAIARFLGTESALCFASGAAANAGLLTSIADAGTLVLSDELNHASVVDACRLSKAQVKVYPHADAEAAGKILASEAASRKLIFTDTVFSMDGDLAPLAALRKAADLHGAELIVDDAHGFGVLGQSGRGAVELAGVEVAARTANLSKAAGSIGGFVAGSADLVRLMESKARSYIYTTASPPAVAEAGQAAVGLVREAHAARRRALALADRLARGIRSLGYAVRESPAPFLPVVLGSEERALEVAGDLWEKGFLVPAIRPPTVPKGTCRLRISVTALHNEEHVDALVSALPKR